MSQGRRGVQWEGGGHQDSGEHGGEPGGDTAGVSDTHQPRPPSQHTHALRHPQVGVTAGVSDTHQPRPPS